MIKKVFLIMICIAIVFLSEFSVYSLDISEDDIYISNFKSTDIVLGDMNFDGKITSADARICLRASAKIVVLSEDQIKVADVYGTGKIDSSCARKILRVAAKLENMNIVIRVKVGQKLIIKPDSGAFTTTWKCFSSDTNDITVDFVMENNTVPDTVGSLYDQFFIIKAEKADRYTLNFKQVTAWNNNEVHNEFFVVIIAE